MKLLRIAQVKILENLLDNTSAYKIFFDAYWKSKRKKMKKSEQIKILENLLEYVLDYLNEMQSKTHMTRNDDRISKLVVNDLKRGQQMLKFLKEI